MVNKVIIQSYIKVSVNIKYNVMFPRWLFETGRLAPNYDYFRCVVNIPEDVQRVEEPSEIDGEQVNLL